MKRQTDIGTKTVVAVVLVTMGVSLAAPAAGSDEATLDTPSKVYTAACAACHGHDGTGLPASRVGFDTPLPDFTDCFFATREPDPDWFAVAHQGGPVRGFGHLMPAFGQALEDGQIEMAVQHIRSFCPDEAWPSGDLNQARPMFTEKAYVEDEMVFTVGTAVERPYAVTGELVWEQRFGQRSQIELVVPFGAVDMPASEEDGGGWGGGLGDVAFGVKSVVLGALSTGTILSGLVELVLPTGMEEEGVGGGAFVFEPALLFGQSLGPAGFIHLQAGAEIPFEKEGTNEVFWRAVYGYTFSQGRFGRAWTPMVEVLGSVDIEDGAEPHWDIVPQLQVALNTRQHVMLGLATRIPLEQGNDRPVGIWVYLLWEWFDGGFGEGW